MRPRCFTTAVLASMALLLQVSSGCRRHDAGGFPEFAPAAPSESNAALVRRAQRLWSITSRDPAAQHALRFLHSLTERLDDDSWWAASAPAFSAWSRLRTNADVREMLAPLTPLLVARVAVAGGAEELTELTRIAGSPAADAAAIGQALMNVVMKPLPSSGFSGSPQERLIAASIAGGDFARAKGYLQAAARRGMPSPELRAEPERLNSALEQCCPSGSPGLADLPRLIRTWEGLSEETALDRTLRRSLEEAVLALLPFDGSAVRHTAALSVVRGTDSEPTARGFWTTVVSRPWRRPPNLAISPAEILQLARLRAAAASFYRIRDAEPAFWKAPEALKKEAASRLAARYLELADLAAAREEYEIASEFVRTALPLGLRSEDPSLVLEIQQKQQKEYPDLKLRFDEAVKARETLALSPDDPGANLILGLYLCGVRDAWETGLPFLRKGPDPALKAMAEQDLRNPDAAADERALGRAWKEFSTSHGGGLWGRSPERAGYWYERALKQSTGADRAAILEELRQLPPGRKPRSLLERVDLRRDVVYGRWTSEADLPVSDAAEFARFEIPYHVPSEFDFRITFTRLGGDGDVVFVIPHPEHPFCWVLSGAGQNCRAWASVKGQWDAGNNPTRIFVPGGLENGRPANALFQIRKNSFRVLLDGRLIKEWSTSLSDVELPEWLALRDPKCPGIATYRSPTRIERIELLEIGSRGAPSR